MKCATQGTLGSVMLPVNKKILLLSLLLLCSLKAAAQITVSYPEGRGPVTPVAMDALTPVQSLAEVGIIEPFTIAKADELVEKGITQAAYPGCRVLAAKGGKVFYDRSFGYLTYDKTAPVTPSTVYDLASLTKVVSTTLAVMRLTELQRVNLDKTLGDYLPQTRGTDKADLTLRNLLLHQAGLKAWIPFYKSLLDSTGALQDTAFRTRWDGRYRIQVAKDLYLREDYVDYGLECHPYQPAGEYRALCLFRSGLLLPRRSGREGDWQAHQHVCGGAVLHPDGPEE